MSALAKARPGHTSTVVGKIVSGRWRHQNSKHTHTTRCTHITTLWCDGRRYWRLHHTGHSQPSSHTAAETENRFGWWVASGRPACARGQHSECAPRPPRMEARTEIPSALVTTPTSAPSQPPAELTGRGSKQQHGAGKQCPGREKGERAGCGRRTGQTPRRSPTEPVRPRSHTLYRSYAAPSGG